MIKIVVSGSREWDWYAVFKKAMIDVISEIQYHHPVSSKSIQIVHGGARGVDGMAQRFADDLGLPVKVFEANWDDIRGATSLGSSHGGRPYNKMAGIERNLAMLKYAKEEKIIANIGKNVGKKNYDIGKSFLVAFQVDKSRGTQNTINIFKKAKIPTYVFDVKYGVQLTLSTFNVETQWKRIYF